MKKSAKKIAEALRDKGLSSDNILNILSEMSEAFDITVTALRAKGLSDDEILNILSEMSESTRAANVGEKTPVQVQESSSQPLTEAQKENKLRDLFLKIGVPRHIKGYKYLIKAVLLFEKEPDQSITKILYPEVAKAFDTTGSRVERAIRHAIECAWDRGDLDVFDEMFGNTVSSSKGKPTNWEFISITAEWLNR